ncbi:MAG: palindromic element RPE2 domain-containing protein [Rickettsia endosymbiont of Platyusa sonomae]|nr:palindromic element RPE2 domain-containing protein [Rickettsia endosymbiont of Platyusa sonomae]
MHNDDTALTQASLRIPCNIVNSGEFGARNDGATPISNRRATSDNVPNFSSIDYSPSLQDHASRSWQSTIHWMLFFYTTLKLNIDFYIKNLLYQFS